MPAQYVKRLGTELHKPGIEWVVFSTHRIQHLLREHERGLLTLDAACILEVAKKVAKVDVEVCNKS